MKPTKDDLSPDASQWWRSIGDLGSCSTDNPCSLDGFLDRLTEAVRHLGFDRWSCSACFPREATEAMILMGSDQPLSRLDRSSDRDWAILHRVAQCAIKTSEPVLWTDELALATELPELVDRTCGMNGGWSKSTHDAAGIVSIFTVSRKLSSVAQDESRIKLPQFLWLAQLAHFEICQSIRSERGDCEASANLSTREKYVLQLSADGKTVGEIADYLEIAERTVTFHVNNAVRKLKARNKMHAVALAVRLGFVG